MRAILIISGTTALAGVGGLLFWRPAMTLALAILGGALSVWRMHRPHKHTAKPSLTEPVAAPPPAPKPQPHAELLERIRMAGWALHAAKSPFPWMIAVSGATLVEIRPRPMGERVTAEDLLAAMAARNADATQFVAILCEYRPIDTVAQLAKENRVHIVNLARLEAYLALAHSFRPPLKTPAPALNRALA